jgi:hypothetical protein
VTGSREVMVAILMIRQYREFIPKDAPVSIQDAFYFGVHHYSGA